MIVGVHTVPYESDIRPVYEIVILGDLIMLVYRASQLGEESDKFITTPGRKMK